MSSVDHFRYALARNDAGNEFRNVLVDWWDVDAGVWRPSVLENAAAQPHGYARSHVDIAVPSARFNATPESACVMKRVRIADLRPSRLVNDSIARFFTARYALEVLEDLQPCINSSSDADKSQLEAVTRDLHRTFLESFSAWSNAFETGSDGSHPSGILFHISDDTSVVNALHQPVTPAGRAMETFRRELTAGELSCSPVTWWDESEKTWRPTMLIGATGSQSQFMPAARVDILIPGEPFAIRTVCGADLRPVDIATAGFSLCALPVLIRDVLRMDETLTACGVDSNELCFQPMLAAVAEMLSGAAREWRNQFESGLPGAAPEPRIVPLSPSLWGLSETTTPDDVAAWWRQAT
jgi:hypothetical protein